MMIPCPVSNNGRHSKKQKYEINKKANDVRWSLYANKVFLWKVPNDVGKNGLKFQVHLCSTTAVAVEVCAMCAA